MNFAAFTHDPNHPDSDSVIASVLLIIGYTVRALIRNRKMAAIAAGAMLVATVLAVAVWPPTYRIETRILTTPSYLLTALASPTRSVPWQASDATTGAIEIIKSRENLRGIIKEANLIETWGETRHGLGKIRDGIQGIFRGKLPEEAMVEAMVNIVDQKFVAFVDNNVIGMDIEWHDPQTALTIIETAQNRFLNGRLDSELSELNETIKILETKSNESLKRVETAAESLREVINKVTGRRGGRRVVIPQPTATPEREPANDGSQLRLAQIQAKIAQLEQEYRQKVATAQASLDQILQRLGPQHPDVRAAQRRVDQNKQPPPELVAFQQEAAALQLKLDPTGTKRPRNLNYASRLLAQAPGVGLSEDPDVQQAMQEYSRMESIYDDYVQRLEDAQIEKQTAQAAFKFKYLVTQPPVLPQKKIKPKVGQILIAGLLAAMLLALFVAVALDLLSNRVQESWQLTRFADLPVLGEIDPP